MKLQIKDGRDKFYTFDTNRILLLTEDDPSIEAIHFETDGDKAYVVDIKTDTETGQRYINVPQSFLTGEYSRIVVYFYMRDEDGNYTEQRQTFRVIDRQEPDGYTLTEDEIVTWDLIKKQAEEYRDQAKDSQEKAKTSEDNAKASETKAKASENASKTSETNAKSSETNAKDSEDKAKASETNSKASEVASKDSETKAKASETKAKESETNSKLSENNAKASELASKSSENNAKISETNASTSEANALASEKKSKQSEENAKASEDSVATMKASVEQSKSALEGEIDTAYTEIESRKNASITAIDTKEKSSIKNVGDKETTVLNNIEAEKTKSVNAVKTQESSSISAVADRETLAINNVKAQETSSVGVVSSYEAKAKASATNAKASETKALEYKNNMQETLNSAVETAVGSVKISGNATVGNTIGTPSVEVTSSGPNSNIVFSFKFYNLKGERGEPFAISKVYASVSAMNAGYATDNVPVGGFVIIDTGNVEDEDNAKLYVKGASSYTFITDLSGSQGIQGPKGDKGEQGPKGDPGKDGTNGTDGTNGKDGTNGTDGKDGKTGQYTAFQYYASSSDTTQKDGAWSDTMPSIAGGKYLWMRTQVVPAGGSISSSAWGTPVLAGTDISKLMTTIETTNSQVVELGDKVTQNTTAINANSTAIATKVNQTTYDDKISSLETSIQQNATNITTKVTQSEYNDQIQSMQSTIEQTAKKIALTVETVDGEQVIKYNGIVISEKDGEGNILIRADKILLDGSVTADKLDVNTLNSTYLTINGTLSNEVLDTVDTAKEGETVSIGSVDDTKCYLASQLKTKIKNTTSNTMSLFSKLGNLSGVRVLNNTDNSFFVESHFEYYKRFTALPFITNIRNAQGSIYYWPTGQYFSFETLEENPIRTSTDGYNWGYGTNSWASNQKGLFGRFALNRYEEVPTLHCVCYKVGTTDPFRLMSTRDGYNFYNQATLARTSVDDSFFMYSSFDSYPVLVTEKHVYFIAPSGVASFSANSDISVQAGDPLGSQSFHEITLPITPEKVFSGILLKTNSILCCALQYNSTKYFYFYKKSSSSWISFAVPDIIKNKNFSETNYYEIGDYLYIVAYKYVGKLNLTTLSSSSTIETMFSGSIYGVIPISNKYLVVLEYDPSLKTYSKHLYSETRRMGGLPANSSLVSSAFFYKTFPSPMGNICYIDDNTTVILSDANYPSLKVSMTEETYPTDVLAFENATDNYLGTIDSLLPKIPTDKQAVSTDLQLNLPTTIPTDMDTYRKIPTLFAKTDVYLSLASASVESYTRFDTSTNQDVIVPAYSGKPSKVTTSSQSLRINDTEYANSSWFIKNKTALAISFTPNAVAKGVYTGDLNPKEVDGESASARDIGNITPYDTITGREITANEKLIAGNIEPKTASANIGSANQKFDQVYVRTVNASALIGVYPVGTIYISTKEVSPGSFLGGAWERLATRFLLPASDTDSRYTAGTVGGAKEHKLTVSELPTNIGHFNALSWASNNNQTGGAFSVNQKHTDLTAPSGKSFGDALFTLSGGGEAFSIMPSYLAVYMWEKISD